MPVATKLAILLVFTSFLVSVLYRGGFVMMDKITLPYHAKGMFKPRYWIERKC